MNLDKTKYYSSSVEEAKRIQNFLFGFGYSWGSSGKQSLKYLDQSCFYANSDKSIGYQNYSYNRFKIVYPEYIDKTEEVINTSTNLDYSIKQIYKDFIYDVGEKGQLLQVVEELGELQHEILKFVRYKDRKDTTEILFNLREELGDVYNALGSLHYILDIDKDKLDEERIEKLYKYHNKIKL
jgi:NTP pyrophosphatase (non-canonical NTP hydrolase)